jgi:hypothetical protein
LDEATLCVLRGCSPRPLRFKTQQDFDKVKTLKRRGRRESPQSAQKIPGELSGIGHLLP